MNRKDNAMKKKGVFDVKGDLFRREEGGNQYHFGWPDEVYDEMDKFWASGAWSSNEDMNRKAEAIFTANGHKVGLSPKFKYKATDELIELLKERGWEKEHREEVRASKYIKGHFSSAGGFVMITDKGKIGGYLSTIPFDIAKRMIVE